MHLDRMTEDARFRKGRKERKREREKKERRNRVEARFEGFLWKYERCYRYEISGPAMSVPRTKRMERG
jgi:hypothetical protein